LDQVSNVLGPNSTWLDTFERVETNVSSSNVSSVKSVSSRAFPTWRTTKKQ